jgi:two-component sensor histidine kinase
VAAEVTGVDLRIVFDHTPTPYVLLDRGFVIVDMNRAYLDAVQRERADIVGRNLFEAFPSDSEVRDVLEASLGRVLSDGVTDLVPVLRYPISIRGTVEERFWSISHVPVPGPSGEVAFILQNSQDVSGLKHANRALWPSAAQTALTGEVLHRAEAVQALNQTLIAEKSFLRELFMKAPSFMCVLQGPTHRFELVNAAFMSLVGNRDLMGRTVAEGLPELHEQTLPRLLDDVYRKGEPFIGRRMSLRIQRSAAATPGERFLDLILQPMVGTDGAVSGIFIEGNDVTDHVQAEQRQSMLIRELHHRVRNTLATVQGVMNSTARTAATIEDYQSAFAGRIASLARTHALLTEEIEQFVSLRQLIEQELGPYVDIDSRIRLLGPVVDLPSQIGVPLGMTIHELTTNAVRHGALRIEKGRLDVSWNILRANDGARLLHLTWRESNGPVVSPPVRAGFGSMLLNRVLAQQIGVEVESDYAPEGFSVAMSVPLPADR